jgi:hypothetical protein
MTAFIAFLLFRRTEERIKAEERTELGALAKPHGVTNGKR